MQSGMVTMCDTAEAGSSIARPRWSRLYAAALSPLAVLAVVEVAGPPNVIRTILRCVLGLAAIAGMAIWVQRNRAALDLQDWCACASASVTVRVITLDRGRPLVEPDPLSPSPAGAEREHELIHG